jgi:hypothetical protein
MKKQTKKLELAKETLQNLENLEDKNLELAAGGRPRTTTPTIC